jgi:hypothetical protein
MSGFDQPYWNSLQLLAWVYLGDRVLVSRCGDDEARPSDAHWHLRETVVLTDTGRAQSTLINEPRGKPSTVTVDLYASDSNRRSTSAKAEEEITAKLREGAFTVTGVRNGQRHQIPEIEWLDVKIDLDGNTAVYKSNHQPKYTDLRFRRADILALWPEELSQLLDNAGARASTDLADAASALTTTSGPDLSARHPIPPKEITKYFEAKKEEVKEGRAKIPAQKTCVTEIADLHPNHRVARAQVIEVHQKTWPGLKPGKR